MTKRIRIQAWRTWLLAFGIVIGLYCVYAGRRIPVGHKQGNGIQWPADIQPVTLRQCRLTTYNIHRGKGTDGVRDLLRTAEVLRGGDFIALNEVAGPAFFGKPDQAAYIGQTLQIGWLFAPNQRRWHMDHFGNALLSRLAVNDWGHEPLVFNPEQSHSHRNLLRTRVVLADQPVAVFVTHLDRGELRSTQLQFVLQLFASHSPAVLLGDLNSSEADPVLARFLGDANNIDAISLALGANDPQGRIDWILVRGLDVLSGGMHPTGVSDHPCFWADVTILDPND